MDLRDRAALERRDLGMPRLSGRRAIVCQHALCKDRIVTRSNTYEAPGVRERLLWGLISPLSNIGVGL
jgi:hypothetical protein